MSKFASFNRLSVFMGYATGDIMFRENSIRGFQSPFGVFGLRNLRNEGVYMIFTMVSIAFRRLWVTQLSNYETVCEHTKVSIAFRRLWVTQHKSTK